MKTKKDLNDKIEEIKVFKSVMKNKNDEIERNKMEISKFNKKKRKPMKRKFTSKEL